MPVNLEFPNKFAYKLTYPDNVYFTPKLDDVFQVTDLTRDILEDYTVIELSNGGYTLQRVSDCKVDEKEILEILQEN